MDKNRNLVRLNLVLGAIVLGLLVVLGILLSRPEQPATPPPSATSPIASTSTSSSPMAVSPSPPIPSPTVNPVTPQPDLKALPLPAPTLSVPGSTLVPFAPPDAGNETFRLPAGIAIQEEHNLKGMFLTLTGEDLPQQYLLGPLARGGYAVGPNQRFLVYITNSGQLYALRLGNPYFLRWVNLKRQLSAGMRNVEPTYTLSFYQGEYAMFVIIDESVYGQHLQVMLPRGITQ